MYYIYIYTYNYWPPPLLPSPLLPLQQQMLPMV
jgi:hypothetical protein